MLIWRSAITEETPQELKPAAPVTDTLPSDPKPSEPEVVAAPSTSEAPVSARKESTPSIFGNLLNEMQQPQLQLK